MGQTPIRRRVFFDNLPPSFDSGDAARCHELLVGGPPDPTSPCLARHPLRCEKGCTGGVERLLDLRRKRSSSQTWKTIKSFSTRKCRCEGADLTELCGYNARYFLQMNGG